MQKEKRARLTAFVQAVKQGDAPNTVGFAKAWNRRAGVRPISSRTIGRDVEMLRERYGAPLTFDHLRDGYVLTDEDWRLPFEVLSSEEELAAFVACAVGAALLPPDVGASARQAAQLFMAAVGDESASNLELTAVLYATGAGPVVDSAVLDVLLEAWRDTRVVAIAYRSATEDRDLTRRIRPHVLFGHDGTWYLRAWCELRKAWRSLAIHRILAARLRPETFSRDPAAAQAVRKGWIFETRFVDHVQIHVAPEKARVVSERQWFGDQVVTHLPDGSIDLRLTNVPRDAFIHWLLSYKGHVVCIHPPELRREIHAAAEHILNQHE